MEASPSSIPMCTFLPALASATMLCFSVILRALKFISSCSFWIRCSTGPTEGLELMIYQIFYGCLSINMQKPKHVWMANRNIYIWPSFLTLHLIFLIIQGALFLFQSIFRWRDIKTCMRMIISQWELVVWVIETRIKGRFLPVMLVHVIVTQKTIPGLPLIGPIR